MKKYINYLYSSMLILGAAFSMVSCSSDDEDLGGPVDINKVPSNAIVISNSGEKLLVSKIGGTSITYNEKGVPLSVGNDILNYENGTLSEKYSDPDETYEGKFAMNGDGYITAIEVVYTSDHEVEKQTAKYEYNKNGLISKITVSGSEDYNYNGESSSEVWNFTFTFTYDGQSLTGSKFVETYSYVDMEDGKKYEGSGSSEVTRTVKSSIKNPLRQHTFSLCDFADTEIYDNFQLAGLYGKAPDNLPTEVLVEEIEYEDGEEDRYKRTDNYSYTFNDDGTIESEKEGKYSTYEYSYIRLGETSADVSRTSSIGERPKKHHRHFHKNY